MDGCANGRSGKLMNGRAFEQTVLICEYLYELICILTFCQNENDSKNAKTSPSDRYDAT